MRPGNSAASDVVSLLVWGVRWSSFSGGIHSWPSDLGFVSHYRDPPCRRLAWSVHRYWFHWFICLAQVSGQRAPLSFGPVSGRVHGHHHPPTRWSPASRTFFCRLFVTPPPFNRLDSPSTTGRPKPGTSGSSSPWWWSVSCRLLPLSAPIPALVMRPAISLTHETQQSKLSAGLVCDAIPL